MDTAEKFRKFAAECQAMTKLARSSESKALWGGLAARWVRCAEIVERHSAAAPLDRMAKRHGKPSLRTFHDSDAEAA
jgi:hypothetical protein